MSKSRIFLLLIGVSALMWVTGCSDDDPVTTLTAPKMGDGAIFRVVHASPDAPAVDVWAKGVSSPIIQNLKYGDTSAYLDLDAGKYTIQLRAAGSKETDPVAYETPELTIPEGAKITALAVGLLGSSNNDDKFRVMALAENFASPGAGNAAVRVIHGSADAPTVAIDIDDDASPEVASFARFADTGEAGVPLPANQAIQIAIWRASPLSRVTAFTTPALPEGGELFVIATGLLGKLPREADGFSLLAVGPSGTIGFIKQNPVVFALHGSPDAPAVDIWTGGAKLITNLAFGDLSDALQVPPGSYPLDFTATGMTTVAASATTPPLAAGERYLAIASGFLGDMSFTLLPYADGFSTSVSGPQARVIHASPDAPPVDVGTVAGGVVTPVADFVNLVYEGSSKSEGTGLPSGSLNIGVAATGNTSPVATFDVSLSNGQRAFVVAAGALAAPAPAESFRLIAVETSAFPWTAAEVQPNP